MAASDQMSLAEQELFEANEYLARFNKAYSNCSLFLGGAIVAVLAFPLMVLYWWLMAPGHFVREVITGGGLLGVAVIHGFWWRRKVHRLFAEIQARCLRVQRAGYTVYRKPQCLQNILGVAGTQVATEAHVLDFERLTPEAFHREMI